MLLVPIPFGSVCLMRMQQCGDNRFLVFDSLSAPLSEQLCWQKSRDGSLCFAFLGLIGCSMAALFFDLDGTLTDPKAGIFASIHFALDQLGVEERPDDLSWCIGPPLQESFARMVGASRTEEAIAAYRQRFAITGLYENEVYDGIPELLARLCDEDFKLYVATSKVRLYATRILEHFGLAHCFTDIFGSELNGLRANKQHLIAYGMDLSGLSASDIIMIGDRKHDIMGAKGNDVRSIGVLWGYGGREELEQAGADHIVADRDGLYRLIRSL